MGTVFFFDRCLPLRLARMLDGYDQQNHIMHQDDDKRFDCKDEDVFIVQALSQEDPKPVFITADVNMYTRKPNERKALRESGLTCVFFKKRFNNLPVHDQAMKVLKLWPEIVEQTSRCRHPYAFEVSPAATKLHRYCLTKDL